MMKEIIDISYFNLLIGYSAMAIVILIFLYFRTGLVKQTLISLIRMTVQLFFVAVYLEYIFKLNNAWINSAWVIVMIFTGGITALKRSELKLKHMLLPVIIAGFTTIILSDAFFLGAVINLDYIFEARYFIPISGMLLGNTMNYNIVGLNTYFTSIKQEQNLYHFMLVHKGLAGARLPFMQKAIKKAINPYLGTISVVGLISLPGMMTGQILGGSSPAIAIKYQIMIILSIFVSCILNLTLSLIFSNKFVFDEYGKLKSGILQEKK